MFRRLALLTFCIVAASPAPAAAANDPHAAHAGSDAPGLAARVREVTAIYRDIDQAIAAGYAQFGGCVSGPEAGAMGVHFVKGSLVDGTLDVTQPEALIYELKDGYARLLGVEYIAPAPAWDAAHDGPPVLQGQHLHLLGSPNRYRLPALYELHVWAWRQNPQGTFADWNTRVSCDGAN
jgi:hypothetical protein